MSCHDKESFVVYQVPVELQEASSLGNGVRIEDVIYDLNYRCLAIRVYSKELSNGSYLDPSKVKVGTSLADSLIKIRLSAIKCPAFMVNIHKGFKGRIVSVKSFRKIASSSRKAGQSATTKRKPEMVVRWMGAFRKGGASLEESLLFELGSDKGQVAAEPIWRGKSHVRACVGLSLTRRSVVKMYHSDVWSMPRGGSLVATRDEAYSKHGEAFCRREFDGIVIKGNITPAMEAVVIKVATMVQLPVIRLTKKGALVM